MNTQNEFIKAALNEGVYTENGAVSYGTIGSAMLDQFGKAGVSIGRSINDVWADQSLLWAEDAELALKFPFYLRMITRSDVLFHGNKTKTVQRGQGARDESFKRLLWIAANHPDEFYRNLWLLPVVGSWKDLFTLLLMGERDDLPISFELNREAFYDLLICGIKDNYHVDLVKKYLPSIKANSKCHTQRAIMLNKIAKDFCAYVNTLGEVIWGYKQYREFKATGKAHVFQKIICGGLYDKIDWKTIPGKALLNLVSGRFLENHNLTENYISWLKSQPTAKFNGYVYELADKIRIGSRIPLATKITVDKQFDGLIETAKKDGTPMSGNVLCALDTSGSMMSRVGRGKITAFDVCVSLGIYFSELNQGAFHNTVAMFDEESSLKKINGTFSDKYNQIVTANTAWGNTNFQSLIDLLVDVRKNHPEIPESEFPSTLLVISDMQFDNCGEETNNTVMFAKLNEVFSDEFMSNFKAIWWYCIDRGQTDFPTTMDKAGQYMISGFDGSIISMILGGDDVVEGEKVVPSMEDVVNKALNQEVLSFVC